MSSGGGGGGSDRRQRRRSTGGGGGHENHERWLLPYADMITLLLALFVILYAISSVNNAKLDALAQSLATAFNGKKPEPGQTSAPPSKQPPQQQAQLNKLLNSGLSVPQLHQAIASAQQYKQESDTLRRLKRRLDREAQQAGFSSQVKSQVNEQGLVITLVSDRVLFDTGKANIRQPIRPLLRKISRLIRRVPNNIRIAGHTDSSPISTAQFPSNWELSAVRATTVLRFMDASGLTSSRLSAQGFGAQRPRAGNRTTAGRQRNRRVEVIVVRRYGQVG